VHILKAGKIVVNNAALPGRGRHGTSVPALDRHTVDRLTSACWQNGGPGIFVQWQNGMPVTVSRPAIAVAKAIWPKKQA
jgi:hypothetical protein